ncbi:TadE family protein [Vibrio hippocampi]|uniref:TadE-like domain-containing protein n=1 Tax=Vibrio hippocampi TaxID=654686 RepID=A0ABM8ZMC0_9VIBR|nr:TadE family protein [Vibrio hippocampi]CAH0529684.1 hypothetical protein VHP8226_03439 [Vibrio hippocampi]
MHRRSKQWGTTTIEFAMGGIVLIFSTFAIFEACYQVYVVNMTEYALRETVRSTKTYQGGSVNDKYLEQFNRIIQDDSNLWHFLMDDEKFSMDGRYYLSYSDFINDIGTDYENLASSYDLAEITVSYDYSPMIEVFGNQEHTITRTMVLNLEHEGWDDEE